MSLVSGRRQGFRIGPQAAGSRVRYRRWTVSVPTWGSGSSIFPASAMGRARGASFEDVDEDETWLV